MAARTWWDVVVFSYGRLREGLEAAKGRTGRLIAVGGLNPAFASDPRVGPLGHPSNLREEHLIAAAHPDDNKIARRMTEARDALFAAHREGHYDATYLSYAPNVYGPRAPGPREWCVIRRILDGRRVVLVPDGGVAVVPRGYGPNLANGVLLAVDQTAASAGRQFTVMDQRQYTLRAIIQAIARYMDYELELLDIPYEFAVSSRAFNFSRVPIVPNTSRIETELGYRDAVSPEIALQTTIEWLLANQPEPGGRIESQIGAVFDYAKEDELVQAWRDVERGMRAAVAEIGYPDKPLPHVYNHPKAPHDDGHRGR
jgi:hypothetical protein